MRTSVFVFLVLGLFGPVLIASPRLLLTAVKTRVVILADMGNEPDEEQQMMHMLIYADSMDIEGLIAVTGKYLRKDPQPELFFNLIEGYDKVVHNLKKHSSGWPTAAYLQSIVRSGQARYGIESSGPGKTSPGSRLLEELLLKNDPRPVYVVVNAGSNTLAQGIIDLEAKLDATAFAEALAKLRVFENGSQDNAGAWICANYPDIHWIRSNYQTYCYGGPSIDGGANNQGDRNQLGPYTWEPYEYTGLGQHLWALEHIKGNHGPFGKYWPIRQFGNGGVSFVEGGGTIPWLGCVNQGLYDINHPEWGGWSGRFAREKVENYWSKHGDIKVDEVNVAPFSVYPELADSWVDPETGDRYDSSIYVPVWRWRRAFFNDFAARMDWCMEDYENANHNPVAAVDGDRSNNFIIRSVDAGAKLSYDASASSDPDGDDLDIRWYVYPEAGTYSGVIPLRGERGKQVSLTIPRDASGKEIHLILEVKDQSSVFPMFDYRRVVLNVR